MPSTNTVFVAAVTLLLIAAALVVNAKPTPDDFIIHSLPDIQLRSRQYAGSLNISEDGKTTAFFWFVESEGDPRKDPVTSFFSGGPCCSSLIALTTEMGPFQMRHGGQWVNNDFSWTKHSNMLFIESPGLVGFSQAPAGTGWDDASTAKYNYAALQKFFEVFSEFKSNEYFLTGESYSGRFSPTLAEQILIGGDVGLKQRMKGLMVGNPCTGFIGCQNPDPTLTPFLRGQGFLPWAELNTPAGHARYDPYDLLVPSCDNDQLFEYTKAFAGAHPVVGAYANRKKKLRDPPAAYGPCAMNYVTAYLNRADVKMFIHAPQHITWNACGNCNYDITNTSMAPLWQRFARETSWKLMIYSGLSDSIVNHAQTETIIKSEFTQMKLAKNEYLPWYRPSVWNASQTEHGGFYLEYELSDRAGVPRFVFCGVKDAGHMVPQYNPPSGLEVFRSFVAVGRCGRLSN